MIGDYIKTDWHNNTAPAINETNLNKIENKIKELDTAAVDIDLIDTRVELLEALQWQAGFSYSLYAPVYYNGIPYRSLINGNLGNQPDLDITKWERTGYQPNQGLDTTDSPTFAKIYANYAP